MTRRNRTFAALIATVVLASAIASGSAIAGPADPAPAESAPPLPPGAAGQDIDIFAAGVLGPDRSFSPAARRSATSRLERLRRRAGGMDRISLALELCRIGAMADNGHTGCQLSTLRTARIGAVILPYQAEPYVVSARAADADLLGARVVAIDGHPVQAIRRAARALAGGLPQYRDGWTASVYTQPEVLHALGFARRTDAAVYTLVDAAGRIVTREFHAGDADRGELIGLPAAAKAPWAFQEPATPFRWRDAPAHGAFLVQLRRNFDAPQQKLALFMREVERQRQALGREAVILDLRRNDGGDMLLTRDLMTSWPARIGPKARFIILMGPRTFSAGMASAAYLKQAGGGRVTLVGEPPGDRLVFFAEGAWLTLPFTGLRVRPAPARDDLRTGCRVYLDCFAGFARPGGPTASSPEEAAAIPPIPVSVRSLDPDIPAPLRIQDLRRGYDPAMRAALDLIHRCARRASDAACREETRTLAGPLAP